MTEQEIQKLFEDIRQMKIQKANLTAAIEDLEEEMTAIRAINYERPRVTGTANSDIAMTIERIWEKQEKLMKDFVKTLEYLTKAVTTAYKLMNLCENAEQRAVLRYKYMELLDSTQIQNKMHYGRTWIYLLEQRAIQAIAKETTRIRQEHRVTQKKKRKSEQV